MIYLSSLGRYVFNARCRKFETLRQLVARNTRDLLLGSKFYGWTYNFDTRDTDLTNASLEPRIIPWSCNFRHPRNYFSIPSSIAIIYESVKIFITGLSSLQHFLSFVFSLPCLYFSPCSTNRRREFILSRRILHFRLSLLIEESYFFIIFIY